jgi:hypothetical protein
VSGLAAAKDLTLQAPRGLDAAAIVASPVARRMLAQWAIRAP